MEEREVKIGEETYALQPYKYEAVREIKNRTMQWVRKMVKNPKTGREEEKVDIQIAWGDREALVIFYSLKRWSLKNERGEPLPITLENMDTYLPPSHHDELYAVASDLNELGEEEKNLL